MREVGARVNLQPMGTQNHGKTLAVVAALLLALGLYTNSWWTMDLLGMDIDIGAFEAEVCAPNGECESESFSEIMKSDEMGFFDSVKLRLTQWGGLLALGLLVIFIVGGAGMRGLMATLYVPTAAVAGLFGWLFYRIFSTSEIGAAGGMGYSFIFFEVGLVLGLVAVMQAFKSRA